MKATAGLLQRYKSKDMVPTFPEIREALKLDAPHLTTPQARARMHKLLCDSVATINDVYAVKMVTEVCGPLEAK